MVPLVDSQVVPVVYCVLTRRVSPFTSHWLAHQVGDWVVFLVGDWLVSLGRPSTGDSHSPSAGAAVVPMLAGTLDVPLAGSSDGWPEGFLVHDGSVLVLFRELTSYVGLTSSICERRR